MKKLGILIISLRDKNQGFPVSLKVFMTERHYIFSFQSIFLGCVLISVKGSISTVLSSPVDLRVASNRRAKSKTLSMGCLASFV